jgi:hypothetical protein
MRFGLPVSFTLIQARNQRVKETHSTRGAALASDYLSARRAQLRGPAEACEGQNSATSIL